jgi:prepilin-type N-terminal cleavage/methylation domain-containing protein
MKKREDKKIFLKKEGFSLIEFVVVISIFAIMTSISMFNYGEQRVTIETNNLAQDVALTIRQAQVYGISASARNLGGEEFNVEHAADFFENQIVDVTKDRSVRGVAFIFDKNHIILYEDVDRDGIFIEKKDVIIDERRIISNRINFLNAQLYTESELITREEGVVDISFERPYPDATIHWRKNIGIKESGVVYDKVDIYMGGEIGVPRYVTVNSIGNITVKIKKYN